MEDKNKFQKPSFIPQGSSQGNYYYTDRSIGLWGLISLIVSVVAFGSIALVYLYVLFLNSQINTNDARLTEIRNNFQPDLVEDLLKFDSREKEILNLLSRYSSSYVFLNIFGQSTVSGIRYNELDYKFENGNATFSAKGQSTSYDAIAFQERVFKERGDIVNTVFNDFALNNSGNINFSLQGNISKGSVGYTDFFSPSASSILPQVESQNIN